MSKFEFIENNAKNPKGLIAVPNRISKTSLNIPLDNIKSVIVLDASPSIRNYNVNAIQVKINELVNPHKTVRIGYIQYGGINGRLESEYIAKGLQFYVNPRHFKIDKEASKEILDELEKDRIEKETNEWEDNVFTI